MNPQLIINEDAHGDINDHLFYLVADSPESAKRFRDRLRDTLNILLYMPEIGRMREFRNPELQGLRYFPVKDFNKYLVFYVPVDDGIQVIRVLHSARDIDHMLNL